MGQHAYKTLTMPKNHRFMLKIARKTPNFAIFHLFWVYFFPPSNRPKAYFFPSPLPNVFWSIYIPGSGGRNLDCWTPTATFWASHHHLGLPPSLSDDRTFEISASTKFAQCWCWIIMNKVEKCAIPVAFFLLPCEKQICYRVICLRLSTRPPWTSTLSTGCWTTRSALSTPWRRCLATRLWYRDALFTGRDASGGRCKSWAWWRLSTTTRMWPSGSGACL